MDSTLCYKSKCCQYVSLGDTEQMLNECQYCTIFDAYAIKCLQLSETVHFELDTVTFHLLTAKQFADGHRKL